ncbi:MAG: alpha/beta fold hydrolase, partial [Verrucomicrobiota bacterium]
AEFGLALENLELRTHDEFRLNTILATRASDPGAALKTREMMRRLRSRGIANADQPRGTILLLHGRGGRKEDMLWIAKRLVAADFRCVVYDARAHGQSEGDFCTFGKNESLDVEAVIDQVSEHLRQRNETTGPVGIFGISLGAAVALQSGDIERPPAALVAVSPFSGLPEIVHRSGKRIIHRHLPRWLSSGCLLVGGWRADFEPDSIVPLESAGKMTTPLYMVHGALDEVIPISQGQEIFSAVASPSKYWETVATGNHGNVLARGGDDLYERIVLFYLRHLAEVDLPVIESR